MAVFMSSVFGAGVQLLTAQGVVLAGGKVNVYQAGTLTAAITYTDATGLVQNGPQITLDSAGRFTQEIWSAAGTKLKFIITDSAGASVGYPTLDNIPLVNDVSTASASSLWTASGVTPSYVNATQFSVPTDVTTTFPVGSRVKYTVTAGTFYGTVSASSYSPSTTTVTIVPDSTGLDSGLSSVQISPITVVGSPADANSITYKPTITAVAGSVAAALQSLGKYTTTAGTSTAYTLTPSVPITAYVAGQAFLVNFNQNSGASPTLNISAQGAKNLKQLSNGGVKIAATVYATQSSWVVYDGTDLLVLEPVIPASKLLRITKFTASGTWTKSADVSSVIVEGIGGGGGAYAGSQGGGGGAGAYFKSYIAAPGATEAVTIGAGGAGGSPGSAGGTSSFGSWCSGGGGGAGQAAAGGGGGTVGAGDVTLRGGGGNWGAVTTGGNDFFGGGGNGFFGGGAEGNYNNSTGVPGYANTGGGGSGGTTTAGAGAAGIIIVYEYS